MKVSLICPIYNEEESVESLIESMISQTKKPDEIIFVDSFSKDKTAEIIKKYIRKYPFIKLIQRKSNIAEARNIAVEAAKNEVIACTDASSKLDKNWLKEITLPFKDKNISVVSGGYIAVSEGGLEHYISMLTVKPMEEWNEETFLPSGRSIAFKRGAWKKVGGYPENLYTGEDTLFDLKLKEQGYKFKLARKAIVYWRGRKTISKFVKQFYLYGKGDGESGNLKRMKPNLLFFIGINLYIFIFIISLFVLPIVSFILFLILAIYFFISGIKFAINKKRLGCLVLIPILLFLKRFSHIFGVWRGLLRWK